jgi:hypothetical protein
MATHDNYFAGAHLDDLFKFSKSTPEYCEIYNSEELNHAVQKDLEDLDFGISDKIGCDGEIESLEKYIFSNDLTTPVDKYFNVESDFVRNDINLNPRTSDFKVPKNYQGQEIRQNDATQIVIIHTFSSY